MSKETSFRVVFRLVEKALESDPPIFTPPRVYLLAKSDFPLFVGKISSFLMIVSILGVEKCLMMYLIVKKPFSTRKMYICKRSKN